MKPRNLLLFAAVLFLLMALKYAFGQDEDAVGFSPVDYEDPAESIFGLMAAAPILGAVFGAITNLVSALCSSHPPANRSQVSIW